MLAFWWLADSASLVFRPSPHPPHLMHAGGVRVPTFVAGGVLPAKQRGKKLDGLVHVSDWYATFSELAGLGTEIPAAGPGSADSISAWGYISGRDASSGRTEIVLDHRMFSNASKNHSGDLCNGQVIWEKEGCEF